MHKCPNCNKEYEGKFCPNCGAEWQEEKICPKCGAKLNGSTRFCNECGYSFVKTREKQKTDSSSKSSSTSVLTWIKSHLKIVIPIVVAVVLIIILSCSIPACIANQTNGTYYKLNYNGELDKKTYFILKSGKWEDEDGERGTYKKDGDKIIFYYTFFGETEELCDGTVSDGILKVKIAGADDVYISEKHKHSYSEWKTVREATCTIDGVQTRTCACGIKETQEIKCVGYHTGEWVVTKEATCTEEGSHYITCTVCNQTITEEIEKISHTLSDWEFDSNNHWKTCSVCGVKIDEEEHTGENKCTICTYPLVDTVGLEYSLNSSGDGYTVTGIGNVKDKIILIPDSYDNLPVVSIGDRAFYGNSNLTNIAIPDSVTSIGDLAFGGCSELTSVVIPNNVTNIGGGVFYDCTKLKTVELGTGIKSLDYYYTYHVNYGFFAGCISLTSITIPDSVTFIGEKAFSGCSGLTSVIIGNGVTSIEYETFADCDGLTSITIPSSVTIIGMWSFSGCDGLTSVTIGNGVESIGYSSFRNCSGLLSVTIGNGVTSIDDSAFENCTVLTNINYTGNVADWCKIKGLDNLMYYGSSDKKLYIQGKEITELIIPDSVTSIGSYAFSDCSNIISITIGDNVTYIDNQAFYGCSGLETISVGANNDKYKSVNNCLLTKDGKTLIYGCKNSVIPNSVIIIGASAFACCSSLENITIPDNVTSIGKDAFRNCSGLTSVTVGKGVTSIGDYAFSFCTALNSIIIDNAITSIGEYVFYGCSGLTSIVIPDSVISIGKNAFQDCSGLTNITIGNGVTSIGDKAFYGCGELETIVVGVNNVNYKSVNNCLLTKDGKTLILGCKNSVIPDGVESIAYIAFTNCSELKNIIIPEGVKTIGNFAFSGCSELTSIIIPSSVTSIGQWSFQSCKNLTVTFKGTKEQWKIITDGWMMSFYDITVCCIDGTIIY